ncbi:MAG: DUF3887 domain-containing protein [Deltaproteobacteria bacterium]|nr:DUF3887 domain-containing protein [Deltaproteobacteria bacterium]
MTGTSRSTARRLATRLTVIIAAALALGACDRTTFEKIPAGEINQAHKAFAEQWGNKIMTAWEKGEYPQVGVEATKEFRAAHNQEERQKAAHKFVKGKVGAFKSMTFHAALRSKPPKGVVYRFKGEFEKGEAEVRVVLDLEGKIIGHFIKPWRDEMN